MKEQPASTDREMFIPCDTCKAKTPRQGVATLCVGCQHNRVAIAWLRHQLKNATEGTSRESPDHLPSRTVTPAWAQQGLAPVEEVPKPRVRLTQQVCGHDTAYMSSAEGFVCLYCRASQILTRDNEDAVSYRPLYTRVPRVTPKKEK